MGRLPTHFASRIISFRIPYSIPGELLVPPSQSGIVFPEATFLVNVDKPFEIHRTSLRVTAMATIQYGGQAGPTLQPVTPQPDTIDKLARIRITDFSKNEHLTKAAGLVNLLLKDNEKTWEWEEPYTLVRSEGFQVQVDTQAYPSVCTVSGATPACDTPVVTPIEQLRIEVLFQGYLIVIAPPSETR